MTACLQLTPPCLVRYSSLPVAAGSRHPRRDPLTSTQCSPGLYFDRLTCVRRLHKAGSLCVEAQGLVEVVHVNGCQVDLHESSPVIFAALAASMVLSLGSPTGDCFFISDGFKPCGFRWATTSREARARVDLVNQGPASDRLRDLRRSLSGLGS